MQKFFKNTVLEIVVTRPVIAVMRPYDERPCQVHFADFNVRIASIKAAWDYYAACEHMNRLKAKELQQLRGIGQFAIPERGIGMPGQKIPILSEGEIEITEKLLLPAVEEGRFAYLRYQKRDGKVITAHDVKQLANHVSGNVGNEKYDGWACPVLRLDYTGEEFLKAALKTAKELSDVLEVPWKQFHVKPVKQFTWCTTKTGDLLYDIGRVTAMELGLK